MKELMARRQALEAQNSKVVQIRDGFKRIDMLHAYLSVYDVLSSKAHSSIGELYARHLLDCGAIKFTVYREEDAEQYLAEIDLVSSVLAYTHSDIHSRLGSDHADHAALLRNEQLEIRAQMQAG
jgi:hypothetical protein